MKTDNSKFKKVHGYEEGKDVLDSASLDKAAAYKKNVLKNFTAIDQNDINARFRHGEFFVSRKYDGEYAIIFYGNGQTVTVNRSGRTRRGIPCIEEAGRLIAAAGIKEGIFPAEIYVDAGYKTRVNDLIHALAHEELIGTLRLAVFDVLEIDGIPAGRNHYPDIWSRINDIFGNGILCHPVDMRSVRSAEEITHIWRQWVDREGSEGLIVHTPVTSFKIKPRHYFDAVVIAYGEGSGAETGQVRRMLFAFMPGPGQYQIMSRVGSGLNEKLRRELFRFFEGKEVPDPVAGLNPKWNGLVFVRPELVIEVAVEEVVRELASGEKTNYLLSFYDNEYHLQGIVPGYRTYTPVFIRLRKDKHPDEHDAGTGQIDRYMGLSRNNGQPEPGSLLLMRDVLLSGDGSQRRYCIWSRRVGDTTEFFLLQTDGMIRKLDRKSDFMEIVQAYEAAVPQDYEQGYSRDQSKLFLSERFIEMMNNCDGYE